MFEIFTKLVDQLDRLPRSAQVAGATILAAIVATRVSRFMIRRVIRRLAIASLAGRQGLWRTRSNRVDDGYTNTREQRRRQRIDAAARMVNHLASIFIWTLAVIAMFHLLDIDAAYFLSSAGFIGAGLAIGGQHKVNDYLSGLAVLFEDRYGVGDTIAANVGSDAPLVGVVEHVGLFSTRLHDGTSTFHVSNHQLVNVENRSQIAAISTVRVQVPANTEPGQVTSAVRDVAGSAGLTDILLVGDVEAYEPHTGEIEVEVRTPQSMSPSQLRRLARRTERHLGQRR